MRTPPAPAIAVHGGAGALDDSEDLPARSGRPPPGGCRAGRGGRLGGPPEGGKRARRGGARVHPPRGRSDLQRRDRGHPHRERRRRARRLAHGGRHPGGGRGRLREGREEPGPPRPRGAGAFGPPARVVAGFVVQGGDPKGNGTGGPGYTIPAEFNARKHVRGTLAMARSQHPDSAGSQFYITYGPQPHLDGSYTVFGQVVAGMEHVDAVRQGDRMTSVTIVEA